MLAFGLSIECGEDSIIRRMVNVEKAKPIGDSYFDSRLAITDYKAE